MTKHICVGDAIQQTFEKFAYIDIEAHEIKCGFSPQWQRFVLIDAYGARMMISCTPALAQSLFDHYTGTMNPPNEQAQIDALKELANVLAGHFYVLPRAASAPRISIPRGLETPAAERMWASPTALYRAVLLQDGEICGGISIETDGASR